MGSSAVIFPKNIGVNPRELLELVGLPSETQRATRQLSGSANDLVRVVVSVVDEMVLRTMEERTADGFSKTRAEVFPQYFVAMVALGALIKVTVPKKDVDWLIAQSLSELEADFRDSGAATFGSELRDRGTFTIWTLRKIHDLAEEVEKLTAVRENAEATNDRAQKFAIHAVWARFHIDCLVKSMRSGKPIFPEIVDSIVDGLRAAVNAYAWIRQEVDQRVGASEPELTPVHWEADDEMLLSDSMRDMTRELP
jgi:hypothetical protein